MAIEFIFVGIPAMLAQFIGGPFDGGVIALGPGQSFVEVSSEAGSWTHYYILSDGALRYEGRSDGIEREMVNGTGM